MPESSPSSYHTTVPPATHDNPDHNKDHSSVSRNTPHTPLVPLEYLQSQRRGSITDPSLHAANAIHPSTSNHHSGLPSAFRHSDAMNVNSSSPSHDSNANHPDSAPRPASNYVFGTSEDVASNGEPINKQIRKILRSPSTERDNGKSSHADTDASSRALSSPTIAGLAGSTRTNTSDQMDIDSKHSPRIHTSMDHRQHPTRQQEGIDYNARRQSLSTTQNPESPFPQGTKRKMSSDRAAALDGDELDSQLVGPGIPSGMGGESEGRATKRRGSAVETHKIAHLSLYERRHSVDSRVAGAGGSTASIGASPLGNGPSSWWIGDRRDSSSSMFSNGSSGYPSAFSAEPPHGRGPAPPPPGNMSTFAWATTQHPENGQDPNAQNHPRPFDSLHIPMMPPMNFSPDRRMSVPDNTPSAAGPTRTLRSRSRPPSRQLRHQDHANSNSNSTGPSSGQEEPTSAPSPSSSNIKPSAKEAGSTPYSRSPELRVSHKLAERKRRKEMKELFDELRDQLPADRGMKASKWEILSKAIDFVVQLKQSHQDMAREIEMLRHEVESMRQGIPPFGSGGPPHPIVYGQGSVLPGQYPPGAISHAPPHSHPPHQPLSRPASSQNVFPPSSGPTTHALPPNGNTNNIAMSRAEAQPA